MNKILVIGDIMIDIHQECDSSRLSPEAPVPVCLLSKTRKFLGGSSNVAAQIASDMGCTMAYIHSENDNASTSEINKFRDMCNSKSIQLLPLKTRCNYVIPEKTRIWSNGQQVCRVDREQEDIYFSGGVQLKWLEQIRKCIERENIKLVILSDYNKGLFDDDFLQQIVDLTNSMNVLTILDPKRPTYRNLRGVSIVTPNDAEMEKTIMLPDELSENMVDTYLVHTRGSSGMDCYRNSKFLSHASAHCVEVFDTCGCGDTVVSFLALSLNRWHYNLNGESMRRSMEAASYAASRTVMHHGSYVLTPDEISAVFVFVR